MRALSVLVALVLLSSSVSLVHAQAAAPGARLLTLQERLLLREQWVRQREHERSQIRIAGPIVGVVLGAAVLGTASAMITRGRLKGGTGTRPVRRDPHHRHLHRVKKRRAIMREIWEPPRAERPQRREVN